MTQLLDWSVLNDPNFPISSAHLKHQRRMHVQQNAKVQRRLVHRAKRFQPTRPYHGNFY